MGLLYVALGFLLLLSISALYSQVLIHFARKRGLYPPKGQVTLMDVRSLVSKKEHILAIRAYREMSGASLKNAKAFVEEMEKLDSSGGYRS